MKKIGFICLFLSFFVLSGCSSQTIDAVDEGTAVGADFIHRLFLHGDYKATDIEIVPPHKELKLKLTIKNVISYELENKRTGLSSASSTSHIYGPLDPTYIHDYANLLLAITKNKDKDTWEKKLQKFFDSNEPQYFEVSDNAKGRIEKSNGKTYIFVTYTL